MAEQYGIALKTVSNFLNQSKFRESPEFLLYNGIVLLAIEDIYSQESSFTDKKDAIIYLRGQAFKNHLKLLGLSYNLFRRNKMGFR